MTAVLRLSALYPLPPIGFIFERLTFDMIRILDADFKAQLAQIVDTGFAAAAASSALKAEITALKGDGRPRTIRFFPDEHAMLAGTRVTLSQGEDSGAAYWEGPEGPDENTSPVELRSDLRVFIAQTGGSAVSLPMPDGSYKAPLWALAGTVWHELHHLATTQQHVEPSWPYSGAWAAAMGRIKAGFPVMMWDPLSSKMVPVNAQSWFAERFPCGCRTVG